MADGEFYVGVAPVGYFYDKKFNFLDGDKITRGFLSVTFIRKTDDGVVVSLPDFEHVEIKSNLVKAGVVHSKNYVSVKNNGN